MFSIGVLWLQDRWGRAQFDAELASMPARCRESWRRNWAKPGSSQRAVAGSARIDGRAGSRDGDSRCSRQADGRELAWFARRTPTPSRSRPSDGLARHADHGRDGWRVLTRRESSPAGDYVILVAGPSISSNSSSDCWREFCMVAAPLMVLMTAGVSLVGASSALRPVTLMAAQSRGDHRAVD